MEHKGAWTKTIPMTQITSTEEVKREWLLKEFITITFGYWFSGGGGCTEDDNDDDDGDNGNEKKITIEMQARMDIMPSRIIRTKEQKDMG